ncbi:MAG: hypothetical protein H6607_07385 [Flavobacteriales bacterium]|nr:hypothetical protein [Flavobacteriales bacterium]
MTSEKERQKWIIFTVIFQLFGFFIFIITEWEKLSPGNILIAFVILLPFSVGILISRLGINYSIDKERLIVRFWILPVRFTKLRSIISISHYNKGIAIYGTESKQNLLSIKLVPVSKMSPEKNEINVTPIDRVEFIKCLLSQGISIDLSPEIDSLLGNSSVANSTGVEDDFPRRTKQKNNK